jgi:LDH2 family malate/lactate/ureidoglycolate dehydrogenase
MNEQGKTMKITVDILKSTVNAGVVKLGYADEEAKIISEVLMYAQLRGNNQGITKIATGGVPSKNYLAGVSVARTNKCGALLSGGNAMVSAQKAVTMAAELAALHGVGIVATNHTNNSSGAIGYFSRQLAQKGFIGIVSVGNGARAIVAPAGSSEAKLGTNPLSYAFPYSGGEVVFDTATAAMSYFGLVEADLKGEQLPEGTGFDSQGAPSTSPKSVMQGATATFAGHRGFGLSILVQMLGGPFAKAGTPGVNEEDGAGTFVMAIDPGLLSSNEEFMRRSTALINNLKSAKPLPGQSVLLPGERGDLMAEKALKDNVIEIDESLWSALVNFIESRE